jgi:hypothetical protein
LLATNGILELFWISPQTLSMDLNTFFHFLVGHVELLIGTIVVLFLLTSIWLLLRSVGDSEGGGGTIDTQSIEGALRRVLAQSGVSASSGGHAEGPPLRSLLIDDEENAEAATAAARAAAGSGASAAPAGGSSTGGAADPQLAATLAEREKKIAELQAQVQASKAELKNAEVALAEKGGGAPVGDSEEVKNRIKDLEARLAEYEIIEDDIADLSMYKEENARLKKELAEVAGGAPASQQSVSPTADDPIIAASEPPAAELADEAALNDLAQALEQTAAEPEAMAAPVVEAVPEPVAPPAPAEPVVAAAPLAPEPQLAEPVAEPIAAAVTEGPLADSPDTAKMIAEAQALNAKTPPADDESVDALAAMLDTDKLLEEVSALDSPVEGTEDDLMGEFKEPAKG